MPKTLKIPPLEQRKKRGFCKFHGLLGHDLSRCTRFRDSIQKALDEGRLKFRDKAKQPMQVDDDPLKKADSMYAEIIGINMVDNSESADTGVPIEVSMPGEKVLVDVEMITEDHQFDNAVVTKDQFAKK